MCVCVCNLSYPTVKAHAPYYIVICGRMALPNFPTSPHTQRHSRKNVTEYKMWVLTFFTNLVRNISHLGRIQQDSIINVHSLHVKYLLFLSDFNQTWIFSTDLKKKLRHQISWISVQWEPICSVRMDRQTDGHNKGSTFSNFANICKKGLEPTTHKTWQYIN